MKMTDEQRYSAVLKELGEVLTSKNTTISCQQWQIDSLKEKLAAAEKERAQHKILYEINGVIRECVDLEAGRITHTAKLVDLQSAIMSALNMEGGAA